MAGSTRAPQDPGIDELFHHPETELPDPDEEETDDEDVVDGIPEVYDEAAAQQAVTQVNNKVESEQKASAEPKADTESTANEPSSPNAGAESENTVPPSRPSQISEANSNASRPSRLSRLSSKISNMSNVSAKLKGMLSFRSGGSQNSGPRLVGPERVVRKYKFNMQGTEHDVDVAHSQDIFYLLLDGKLQCRRKHLSKTFSAEFYELEFLVPIAGGDSALPGKLTVKWRVAAGKWHYELKVGGKVVPCLWKRGKDTVHSKEPVMALGSDVQTTSVPEGAASPTQSPRQEETTTAPAPEPEATEEPQAQVGASQVGAWDVNTVPLDAPVPDDNPTQRSSDHEGSVEKRRAEDLALLSKAPVSRRSSNSGGQVQSRESDPKANSREADAGDVDRKDKHISMSARGGRSQDADDRAHKDLELLNKQRGVAPPAKFAPPPRGEKGSTHISM
mmetsp:Transcript_59633/g.141903  ORF Transcript_59633/g.141903 Transcript_59633/m.141903 type:complete len:448 (+) Transcript_59633:79-1422(+)